MVSKVEVQEAVKEVIALPGNKYTAWRSRLRHVLTRRRRAVKYGFVEGSGEFHIFLQLKDMLVKQFDDDEGTRRFELILAGITKERQKLYMSQYTALRKADPALRARDNTGKKFYMRDYRARLKDKAAEGADMVTALPDADA